MENINQDFINGFEKTSGLKDIAGKAYKYLGGVVKKIKEVPSKISPVQKIKKTINEFGENFGDGLTKGIKKNINIEETAQKFGKGFDEGIHPKKTTWENVKRWGIPTAIGGAGIGAGVVVGRRMAGKVSDKIGLKEENKKK